MAEVRLKLVFTVGDATQEITAKPTSTVGEVKKTIMDNHWRDGLPPLEKVDRIRLLSAGRELGGKGNEDMKTLREVGLTGTSKSPVAVHVMVVEIPAATSQAGDAGKPPDNESSCQIL
mmetsp:Transcript_33098/g.77460  ORF Transcript_33098/g.77460 Transcript_33098/m.77460 type:complete len:118 (+) Transcript_33098:203-556(+)|eukprot:CAMPEP_0178416018 /NCGR_PEP_ID=MMETSP0689_2-20121128/23846_1 /TAXON_ID=160604 /ORGANISM="Amphidinium massartii, Strain CS-259" /LENGTH=117 /DNA_ID=CAMNT_0020037347 /DNA_START=122 /DNA_END=475 /DNA_ORIENTATION=-